MVGATWTLPMDGEEEEELVDDEALLTEEDRQRPAAPGGAGASLCALGRVERESWLQAADQVAGSHN